MDESPNDWIDKTLSGEVTSPNDGAAIIQFGERFYHVFLKGKRLNQQQAAVRQRTIAERFTDWKGGQPSGGYTFVELEEMGRPSRERLHLLTATNWSERALCHRAQVGCVLTDSSLRRILSFGYNGPARGLPHDSCQHQAPGNCGCLHAEANAVASSGSQEEKVAFITHQPCHQCAQLLIQANVQAVFYLNEYRDPSGVELLSKLGVRVAHYPI